MLSQENDRAQKFVNGFKKTLETANNKALSSDEELEFRTAQFAADKKALEVQLAERFAESADTHNQITRLTADVEEAFEADVSALRQAGEAAAAASAKVILRLTSEVSHLRGSSGREAVALVDTLEGEVENGKRLEGLISDHIAAKAAAEEEVKSYKEKLRKAIDMGKGFKADKTGNAETAARLEAELVALKEKHAESAAAKDVEFAALRERVGATLEQQTDDEKEATAATAAAASFAAAAAIAAAADTEKKTGNSQDQVAAYKEKLKKAIEMGKSIEAERKQVRATVAEREAEIARLTAAAEAEAAAAEVNAAASEVKLAAAEAEVVAACERTAVAEARCQAAESASATESASSVAGAQYSAGSQSTANAEIEALKSDVAKGDTGIAAAKADVERLVSALAASKETADATLATTKEKAAVAVAEAEERAIAAAEEVRCEPSPLSPTSQASDP
jgi:hypothetical protein